MKPFTLNGTPNGNLKKLEVVINQLMRKAKKVTTFAVPPIPISFYTPILPDADAIHSLNVIEGTTKNFFFYCDKIEKVKEVIFELDIINTYEKKTYYFNVTTGSMNNLVKELTFFAGDKIKLRHTYAGELENVWVGWAIYIDKKNFDYNKLVIDTLNEATE